MQASCNFVALVGNLRNWLICWCFIMWKACAINRFGISVWSLSLFEMYIVFLCAKYPYCGLICTSLFLYDFSIQFCLYILITWMEIVFYDIFPLYLLLWKYLALKFNDSSFDPKAKESELEIRGKSLLFWIILYLYNAG